MQKSLKNYYLKFFVFSLVFCAFAPLRLISTPLPPPCTFVIFGATGDLTSRKILPALYQLGIDKQISENVRVIGCSRSKMDHNDFRLLTAKSISQFSRTKQLDSQYWDQFKEQLFYVQSNVLEDNDYIKLKKLLIQIESEFETQGNRIFYLAVQPSYFPTIIASLKKHQLIYESENPKSSWSRVIIEKPFGVDLDSAVELQRQISKSLLENQVFRIDHYLGKEGVQNLLSFRFENELFKSAWNHQSIENVQITLAENIGIGSRGLFWEETGALRDLFQNHLLQLLAIIAMEPPEELTSEYIHKEKIRVLESLRPICTKDIDECVIRGQYGPGSIQKEVVKGYREEDHVSPTSDVETFVAMKLFIDNERWKGVPFYIRGGKRLGEQTTEIAITFKKKHSSMFSEPNVLFIRIQPNAGIYFKMQSKVPGFNQKLKSVFFGYSPEVIYNKPAPEAYERMIFDCMCGNQNLFVKGEEQILAWRFLQPILEEWSKKRSQNFPNYESGSWGPKEAQELLDKHGHQWQRL